MRPTRRAAVLAALCALALALGWRFGPRALNALVAPALVALAAGVVQVRGIDRPTVRRSQPAPGFPGETRTMELGIETDAPRAATVNEEIGDGLSATDATDASAGSIETSLPATVTYDVTLDRRGEHRLGPAEVVVSDALGLFERTFGYSQRTAVLVYPARHELSGVAAFAGLDAASAEERGTFDGLREYIPGDALRDVHWATSAKRDDLVVVEFATESEAGVTIAAEAAPGCADAMAAAAASIAHHLLDTGVAVSLVLPEARIDRAGGAPQRARVLGALARTGAGRLRETTAGDAGIHVHARPTGVRVAVEGREIDFEGLIAGGGSRAADDRRERGGRTGAGAPGPPGAATARPDDDRAADGRATGGRQSDGRQSPNGDRRSPTDRSGTSVGEGSGTSEGSGTPTGGKR